MDKTFHLKTPKETSCYSPSSDRISRVSASMHKLDFNQASEESDAATTSPFFQNRDSHVEETSFTQSHNDSHYTDFTVKTIDSRDFNAFGQTPGMLSPTFEVTPLSLNPSIRTNTKQKPLSIRPSGNTLNTKERNDMGLMASSFQKSKNVNTINMPSLWEPENEKRDVVRRLTFNEEERSVESLNEGSGDTEDKDVSLEENSGLLSLSESEQFTEPSSFIATPTQTSLNRRANRQIPLKHRRTGRPKEFSSIKTLRILKTPSRKVPGRSVKRHPTSPSRRYRIGRYDSLGDTKPLVMLGGEPQSAPSASHDYVPSFNNKLTFKEKIGSSDYSEVFRAVDVVNGVSYAVKRSRQKMKTPSARKRQLCEIENYRAIGPHENILVYYSAWQEDFYLLMATEYCAAGSIEGFFAEATASGTLFKVETVQFVIGEVSKALAHIHKQGYVHMDIKGENIFLTAAGSIKVGDLGLSCREGEPPQHEGDARYVSLESIQQNYLAAASKDIFSLGIFIMRMMFQTSASKRSAGDPERYAIPTTGEDYHRLRRGQIPSLISFNDDFRSLEEVFSSCTRESPMDRPSASQIVEHCSFGDIVAHESFSSQFKHIRHSSK